MVQSRIAFDFLLPVPMSINPTAFFTFFQRQPNLCIPPDQPWSIDYFKGDQLQGSYSLKNAGVIDWLTIQAKISSCIPSRGSWSQTYRLTRIAHFIDFANLTVWEKKKKKGCQNPVSQLVKRNSPSPWSRSRRKRTAPQNKTDAPLTKETYLLNRFTPSTQIPSLFSRRFPFRHIRVLNPFHTGRRKGQKVMKQSR